jgi:uncharacterized protein with ATP-grasp and redox domains
MRIQASCSDCLLTRVEYETRLVCSDEARIRETVDACALLLEAIREEPVAAPVIASRVHRTAYTLAGSSDPYARLKAENTRDALAVCRQVQGELRTFRDRALAAVIGNTLDYGSREHTVTDDFIRFFRQEFARGLTIDHTDAIAGHSRRVVYLCDNCGEIVFDRLLIERLKERGSRVTVAVRGAPILNDATLSDARMLGLDSLADLLTTTTNGIHELGLNPDLMPADLGDAVDRATLIIAKGMANYESLSEMTDLPPVAYLMSVKCDPIARHIGMEKGSRIAYLVE